MRELLQVQQSFLNNVMQRNAQDLNFISSNFPHERFDVYRQTIFENMANALRITYPGIWKLVGDECANSIAYAYCQIDQHLPKTGCLDDFGESFSQFLSTLTQLSRLSYLQDYAQYEWLTHLSYTAADSKPISPSDLGGVHEDIIDHIKFNFCPAVFIFKSIYPLFDIHEVVQDCAANSIKLKQEGAYGIIGRKENEVHTYWLSAENWFFVKNLLEGQTLSASAEYAKRYNNNFDLSSVIAFILQAKLVDKIVHNGG